MTEEMLQNSLRLLQLADSSFPSGAFTQSFGLETFIQADSVKNPDELKAFMKTYLYYAWRPTDLLAVKLAFTASSQSNTAYLTFLDTELHAMKLPQEGREGSMKMGKRLRQLLTEIDDSYSAPSLPFGQHAIIFGHYGSQKGIDLLTLLMTFAHMTVVSLVLNGVRAIPIGQTGGQQVISFLQPLLKDCVVWALTADKKDLGGSAPALDWAGMAHETLYSRIFMS